MTTGAFTAPDVPDPGLVETCVHCGFCLPTCPTYALWGEEMDSPRGRIYLMKAAGEGRTTISPEFVEHFDRCLGCLACVTACPSGVQYGPLFEATRSQIERQHVRPPADRLFRWLAFKVFPFRRRMRLALLPALAWRPVAPWFARTGLTSRLPSRLAALIEALPPVTLRGMLRRVAERTASPAPRGVTVGLLTGCVQQLVFPEINDATVRVLAAEGCHVAAPSGQPCCGALSLHAGRLDEARAAARKTIETFERARVDYVVANAAGCGSALKEYGHLLDGDPAWAERARAFSARVRDVSELLVELGPPRAPRHPLDLRVVYQDACHLSHAQGVRQQPRTLLASIPGVTLLEGSERELCCGSAGIYNLLEPGAARDLGARKLQSLSSAFPAVIATGNPGCRLQLASTARRHGVRVTLRHPIELLDLSIRGEGLDARGDRATAGPPHSPR